jgi:hypothetical protein
MELQLDATITVFIDLLDQLNMFRANICPSSGAQELVFYSIRRSINTIIVASSWSSIFTLPTLMMHGQTQIKPNIVDLMF